MADLTLVIGTKTYSSWSLRPWLALHLAQAPFREILIRLRQPDTLAEIRRHSPSGRVPLLIDGTLRIWDSLAICEYAAERFPAAGLWPEDSAARATARAVSAEMHAGFAALRRDLSMDCQLRTRLTPEGETEADIDRITTLWRDCRDRFGAGGPFLFGRPTIADCMYAPVVSRFVSYDIALDPACAAYRDAVLALPAMQAWLAAAAAETV